MARRRGSRRTAGRRVALSGEDRRDEMEEGMGRMPWEPGRWRKRRLAAGEVLGVVMTEAVRLRRWIWSWVGQSI